MEEKFKRRLIDKALEKLSDLDTEESLEVMRLDIYSIVEEAILAKLESMSEDEILELL